MNYTLHQLRVFLKVAETRSITKAAEELHLTQPAVSIQLKKLQDQFELPLVELIGRKLYVTDFGEEIVRMSERVIHDFDEIKYKTLAYKGNLTGTLRISTVSTAKYVMPFFLPEFLQKHRGVDLKMDVTNRGTVMQHLEKNSVDFAMVSVLPHQLTVDRVPLMENKLYLVGNPNLLPTEDGQAALADGPLIFREKGSATRAAMENFLGQRRLSARKSMTLTSNEAVKQAVIAGLGYSIMPLIGLKNELLNGSLSIIPHEGLPVITYWNLVWLNGKHLSPIAQTYLDHLKETKEELITKNFGWYLEY